MIDRDHGIVPVRVTHDNKLAIYATNIVPIAISRVRQNKDHNKQTAKRRNVLIVQEEKNKGL